MRATRRDARRWCASSRPDVVVADILTLAPALAAELEGVPVRDADPARRSAHRAPGCPPYSLGARLPRTAAGRGAVAARSTRLTRRGLERGRARAQRDARGGSGLRAARPRARRDLAASWRWSRRSRSSSTRARGREPTTHVVGPLLWEPPVERRRAAAGRRAAGAGRAVDLAGPRAPAAARGAARARRRAGARARDLEPPAAAASRSPVPANARLVDWVSYARTMPRCDVVVCHGGHGTLVRALACGCAVVACPAAGDMNENAARVDWAGVGVRVPRRLVRRRSGAPGGRARAGRAADARARGRAGGWWRSHDPPARAAELIEALAGATRWPSRASAFSASSRSATTPSGIRTSVRIVEREWLAERLEAGASIEAIAREVGRDPSTVSYWARKHGLTSSHAARHAARGPHRARAAHGDRRPASSRSATWPTSSNAARRRSVIGCADTASRPPRLTRARLGTAALRREAPHAQSSPCPRHGMTRHVRRASGFRVRAVPSRRTSRPGDDASSDSSSRKPAGGA